jgi:hypothetical protein
MTGKGSTSFDRRLSTIMIIVVNVILVGGLLTVLTVLPLPLFLPCTDPFAQRVVLTGCAVFVIQVFVGAKIIPQYNRRFLILEAVVILLAAWLGSYPFSPLGFSDGRIPVLRGFSVTTAAGRKSNIVPGEILLLGKGSIAAFKPVMLTGDVRCNWSSANGGALDDPQSCDVVYSPPGTEYDILKLSIRPGCGLPNSIGQIKISILP